MSRGIPVSGDGGVLVDKTGRGLGAHRGDTGHGEGRRVSSLSLAMRSNVSALLLTRYWN
jgi:hypothetical protein